MFVFIGMQRWSRKIKNVFLLSHGAIQTLRGVNAGPQATECIDPDHTHSDHMIRTKEQIRDFDKFSPIQVDNFGGQFCNRLN